MTPMNTQGRLDNSSRVASGITFLLGIWLFVSPWVYGSYVNNNSWNSWIVGAAIALFAAIRFSNDMAFRGLSWVNCLLGIWTFFSPWIYGYTGNTGRFINSLCVGVVVFILALYSATHVRHLTGHTNEPMTRTM